MEPLLGVQLFLSNWKLLLRSWWPAAAPPAKLAPSSFNTSTSLSFGGDWLIGAWVVGGTEVEVGLVEVVGAAVEVVAEEVVLEAPEVALGGGGGDSSTRGGIRGEK